MSKLFTDFEMTKDEYNLFEEWLKQHDKEVVQDYIDKVVEELSLCFRREYNGEDEDFNYGIRKAIEIIKGWWK